jgi:hypothetical protein
MISITEAEELAIEFLVSDLEIPEDDQDWFSVINSRLIQDSYGWYIVELGVAGLPDKWVIQVYDHGECDPSYTFYSPLDMSATTDDLAEYPESIAEAIEMERQNQLVVAIR